jgi:hypothetical protein
VHSARVFITPRRPWEEQSTTHATSPLSLALQPRIDKSSIRPRNSRTIIVRRSRPSLSTRAWSR